MQKTVRRSACLLFILTLAAAIVIPTVAEPVSEVVGSGAQSDTAQTDDAPLADDYELSETLSGVNEPKGEDLVKVVVEVNAPSLIEYANEKGISVQEAMQSSEGIRVLKKAESMSESAAKALSPYLVEMGFSYGTLLSGFSATIHYKRSLQARGGCARERRHPLRYLRRAAGDHRKRGQRRRDDGYFRLVRRRIRRHGNGRRRARYGYRLHARSVRHGAGRFAHGDHQGRRGGRRARTCGDVHVRRQRRGDRRGRSLSHDQTSLCL